MLHCRHENYAMPLWAHCENMMSRFDSSQCHLQTIAPQALQTITLADDRASEAQALQTIAPADDREAA